MPPQPDWIAAHKAPKDVPDGNRDYKIVKLYDGIVCTADLKWTDIHGSQKGAKLSDAPNTH